MTVTLYFLSGSPPARAVILTLETLGIPYELKIVDLSKGEQKSEKFLKLNPQHTIPMIQDEDGFVIWDSHAINAYLVSKYGKDDKLYPKELKARAITDQRLHFDTGVLFAASRNVWTEICHKKTTTEMTVELTASLEEAYDFLEKFLQGKEYIAGNAVTIADFSIITTLGNTMVFAPLNKDKFPLLTEYLKRCELNIPKFKEINEEGIQSIRARLINIGFKLPSP